MQTELSVVREHEHCCYVERYLELHAPQSYSVSELCEYAWGLGDRVDRAAPVRRRMWRVLEAAERRGTVERSQPYACRTVYWRWVGTF